MSKLNKMILVPEAMLEDNLRRNEINSTPVLDRMVALDKEMDEILATKNLSADEKIDAYSDALRRHRIHKEQLHVERVAPVTKTIYNTPSNKYTLIDKLPTSFRQRAHGILNALEENRDLEIDYDQNKFTHKTHPTPDSNLQDSLRFILSRSKHKAAPPSHHVIEQSLKTPRFSFGGHPSGLPKPDQPPIKLTEHKTPPLKRKTPSAEPIGEKKNWQDAF